MLGRKPYADSRPYTFSSSNPPKHIPSHPSTMPWWRCRSAALSMPPSFFGARGFGVDFGCSLGLEVSISLHVPPSNLAHDPNGPFFIGFPLSEARRA